LPSVFAGRKRSRALSRETNMDSMRFILLICLAMVTMKLWTSWETSYGPQTTPQQVAASGEDPVSAGSGDVPALPDGAGTESPVRQQEIMATTTVTPATVEVSTDVFRIKIDPRGAGIHHAALLDYPISIDKPDEPFVLMEDTPGLVYLSQGGLLSLQPAPTHETLYHPGGNAYALGQGQEGTLSVPFTWSGGGITVNKIFEFERGSHLIKVRYRIKNNSGETWSGRSYSQFKRFNPEQGGMRLIYTYTGAVISGPENRYEKIAFDDITDQALARDTQDGWVAMIQHYFVTALVPTDKNSAYHYYTRALDNNLFAAGAITPALSVAPGEEKEIVEQIYIGPKDQDKLAQIATGLDLTVDYGMLWFIAKPLFLGLSEVHKITGNWGWSIILITIFLKVLFYKLSAAGYRSMANMRRVQPRLIALRDRYKEDRVRMNQAMMQIYKEEKINPFGGCLPILVQIPVFIALYWVLLESIELRQAGFIFWLQDLSTRDPYYVLPLIMGVTMFIQQKLNPAPMDPVQAKVMMILPFVFTVFFAFFPSGLVLYWVANNVLSIIQQWMITRSLERAGLGAKPG